MFKECEKLKDLDLHSFNTSNVNDFSMMFYRCYLLKSLNLRNFDTSKQNRQNSFS
ncbi:BspA family leucine-rich repeat surface protein [Butyrivibrio sp. VCD2006]|uniref:BspA family leucine-rich repeat surface protein n=1 Tax=Butyrivibrio sp. VCD2006 TaxID=1280664 RepID=UPI000420A968